LARDFCKLKIYKEGEEGEHYVSIYSCESGSNKKLPAVQEKENGIKV
jgi:hypothetical protein